MKIFVNLLGSAVFCFSTWAIADNQATNPALKVVHPISETHNIERRKVNVLTSKMSYLVEGEGSPVVLIHGNPTSSYLWRNVIPEISAKTQKIAPDLIGMGRSSKPDLDYTFDDHFRYFEAFIEALALDNITLVGHDWGAAIAWEYARKHPNKVRGIAFMEGVLPPAFPVASFASMGEEMGNMFRAFKDEKMGHELVIEQHMFVEKVLPGFVNRTLGDEAMQTYRAPYKDESTRTPLLQWPRQIPIAGTPKNTQKLMENIQGFMGKTQMPTLLLYASPGVVTPEQTVPWYIDTIKNIETVYVGAGFHFIQEDQPQAIGKAINDWIRRTGI